MAGGAAKCREESSRAIDDLRVVMIASVVALALAHVLPHARLLIAACAGSPSAPYVRVGTASSHGSRMPPSACVPAPSVAYAARAVMARG